MSSAAVSAIFLFVLLFAAAGLSAYSKLSLLHKYRVEDYTSEPNARRLYWSARAASFLVGIALIGLAALTKIWWIEAAAGLFFAYIIGINAWATWMRFSGKHTEYYRAHQWK